MALDDIGGGGPTPPTGGGTTTNPPSISSHNVVNAFNLGSGGFAEPITLNNSPLQTMSGARFTIGRTGNVFGDIEAGDS